MPDTIHVHDHEGQCVFGEVSTGDFTPAELDAAIATGVLRQGGVELPVANLGVLRVRDDWDGPGASNAGAWLPVHAEDGTCRCNSQGLQRGSVRMPPDAFVRQGSWDRFFGVGAFGLEPVALRALADPGVLTWGFELETQRTAGGDRSGYAPDVLTPEQWVDARTLDPEDGLTRDAMAQYLRDNAEVLLRGESAPSLRDSVRAWLAAYVRRTGVTRMPLRDWLRSRFTALPVQVGEDGTVRGFEIRTRGGLTPDTFDATARAVLEVPHEVDTGCSFHIHCRLPGERQGYSREFHRHLTEWLVCHVDEMPAAVRRRLASDARERFFAPRLDENKYRAVHCHPEFGTWEFRLFGNLNAVDDALACRRLAERAVLHALRVANREAEPLLAESNYEELQRIYTAAFESGRRPAAARRVA